MADKLTERDLESLFQKYMPSDEMPPGLADRVQQRVLAEVAVSLRSNQEQLAEAQPQGWWNRLLDSIPQLHMGSSFAMAGATAAILVVMLLFGDDLAQRVLGLLNPVQTGNPGDVALVEPTESPVIEPGEVISGTVAPSPVPSDTPVPQPTPSETAPEETPEDALEETPEEATDPDEIVTDENGVGNGVVPTTLAEAATETPTPAPGDPATDVNAGSPTVAPTDTVDDPATDDVPDVPPANATPTYTPPTSEAVSEATSTNTGVVAATPTDVDATNTPSPTDTNEPTDTPVTPVQTVVTQPTVATNTPRPAATDTPLDEETPELRTPAPTQDQSGAAPTASPTLAPVNTATAEPTNTATSTTIVIATEPLDDPLEAPSPSTPTSTPTIAVIVPTVEPPTATFTPSPTVPPTATPEPTATPTVPPTATPTQVLVPIAVDDLVNTNEDVPVSVNVLANDTNTPAGSTQITLLAPPSNGTLVAQGPGSYLYTPNSNYSGSDVAIYQVSVNGLAAQAVISFQVAPVNDAPTFTSTPNMAATEGQPYAYNIAASDIDGDALSFTATGLPAWLALTDNGNGTATLAGTPGGDAAGQYAVNVVASDGPSSVPQTFTIVVENVNAAPEFTSTPNTVAKEGQQYTYNITTQDADGDSVSISGPVPGWLTLTDNGNGTATLSGTPNNEMAGNYDVNLVISDGQASVSQAFTIVVENVNIAPTITSQAATAATEGQPYSYNISASDADGDSLTYSVTKQPSAPWLILTDNQNGTATLSGTPSNTAAGNYAVTVTVSDGETSTPQSFTIVVANTSPSAVDDTDEVSEDGTLNKNVLSNDGNVNGNVVTVTVPDDGKPQHGTVSVNDDNSISYEPNPNYFGPDEFTYSITDNQGGSDSAKVAITVTSVDDGPPVISSSAPGSVETGANYNYVIQASDPDAGGPLTYSATIPQGWGWLTLNENRLSGIPAVANVGERVITVTVTAADGDSTTQEISIEVLMSQADSPPSPLPSPETTGGD